MATIHKKPTSNTPGQIIKVEKPMHVSNVAHIENDKPVKVGFEIDKSGKKIRISRKTKKKIG
jgi:large subunit ribosomal protein L24